MQSSMHASSMSAMADVLAPSVKCRHCDNALSAIDGDDFEKRICGTCEESPGAAKRLKAVGGGSGRIVNLLDRPAKSGRTFTSADKSIISKLHGYIPDAQLLGILNERLVGDMGDGALLYTKAQLHEEVVAIAAANPAVGRAPAGGHAWASLRKILNKAARSGVLKGVTEQVINDFAVVYSLNPKQVLILKDIVLQAKKEKV